MFRRGILTAPLAETEGVMEALAVLAGYWARGLRQVIFISGMDAAPGFSPADVENLNRLLKSRDLAAIRISLAGADSPPGRDLSGHLEERARISRRRALFDRVVSVGEDGVQPLTQLQARAADRPGALFARVPVIDPQICTGCDACLRICPHDILSFNRDGAGGARYDVAPSGCDGCAICADLCGEGAISIQEMRERPEPVALTEWTCRACRAPVHAPVAGADGLCSICARSGHHKKLFQVWS